MGFLDKLTGGSKKREAFYSEYADSHNLKRSKERIPAVTKNLDGELETNERFDGQLAPGIEGTVALTETTIRTTTTMVTTERDASINTWMPEGTVTTETSTNADAYPSTVVQIPVGKLSGTISGLAVKRNYNKQSGGKNTAYGELPRLIIEGTDLEDKYYVYADENADPAKVREIFTPSFSAWLNQREEKFFSFEVGEGLLVYKRPKHAKDAEELDADIATACEIARSLEGSV